MCLKQTFDTEERITVRDGAVVDDGVRFVINPYDEYAVEEAIRLREEHGGNVTVVSVGPARAEEALRTALAMGADEAILVDDALLTADEHTIAVALAAVAKQKSYDLILAGNQAVDDGSSQVALRLAALLDWPHLSTLTKLTVESDESAIGERDAEGDVEVLAARLPVVVTAQQGLNDPRYPSLIGIRKAAKKPLTRLTAAELGIPAEELLPKTEVVETLMPPAKQKGKILAGELKVQVEELVEALKRVHHIVQ